MKGIKCCAECADYSLKKHKCTRGAKDPGKATDSFYADCPLDDAEPVRHGQWENPTESKPRMFERTGHTFTERQCSECKRWNISVTGSIMCKYCPNCGAKMDGGESDA